MIEHVIERWQRRAFDYGEADCCQFVGECIEAVTNWNPMSAIPVYSNEHEANMTIAALGGLEAAITTVLGIKPFYAYDSTKPGVTLHELPDRELCGFLWRGRCIVRTKRGVTDWSPRLIKRVWILNGSGSRSSG